jgi:predicted ferric reductase
LPVRAGLHPAALVGLYVATDLLPLTLAAFQGLPARNLFRETSSGLAMIGFAGLLGQFLLSGRFRTVSGRVGIDLTMRFHQLAAWMILAFIFVHPFLYAAPRLTPHPLDAAVVLQGMFQSPRLRTGVVGWLLLIALVLASIWRDRLPVRYEVWRLSHGIGAALIAGLSAHHTVQVGTYAADPLLTALWLVLTALALASLAYVYGIKPLLQMREPYRVISNTPVAHRMWEVAIEPTNGSAIPFAAGQFGWVNLGHSPFSLTEHPFSMSSAPAERPRIAFTIKESGDFTSRIGAIPVGTKAYLDGPHGNFTLIGRGSHPVVLIAGGVGFAPIMSILRQLETTGWPHPIALVYGNRVEKQVLYREEIERMRTTLPLRVHLVLSEPPDGWTGLKGELSREILRACLAPVEKTALHFVCGPTPMMDAVEEALIGFGVPAGQIVSERFKYD